MFILDCCREFRYASTGDIKQPEDAKQRDSGLKTEEVDPANGTIFARSCGANSKASDGKGNNGAHTINAKAALPVYTGVADFACLYTTIDCVGTRGDPFYQHIGHCI